jgi:putative tryptophan/tyrosine transport system substrate-binding protein
MDRRRFLLVSLAGPCIRIRTADAQDDTGRAPVRIGRLSPLSRELDTLYVEAFRKGLRDLGWVEGKTFTLEARFSDGHVDRLPRLAAELVQQRVSLILTGSTPAALAAKNATATIPIVMITTGDPVADKIVRSLARPGGNVTGLTALGQGLATKRLELLKDTVPHLKRVGVLIQPTGPYTAAFLAERDAAARALGLDIRLLLTPEADDIEKALAMGRSERVEAVMVQTDPLFLTNRRRIVDSVAKSRLPAVYGERQFVEVGGLMFYGASLTQMYRDAAVYADRLLKGARPADLPVEQPRTFDFVINLKTAKALGLTIPPSLLLRADQVIE